MNRCPNMVSARVDRDRTASSDHFLLPVSYFKSLSITLELLILSAWSLEVQSTSSISCRVMPGYFSSHEDQTNHEHHTPLPPFQAALEHPPFHPSLNKDLYRSQVIGVSAPSGKLPRPQVGAASLKECELSCVRTRSVLVARRRTSLPLLN